MPPSARVVVTGAAGQVGREVVARFQSIPNTSVVGLTRADCDASDYHQVMQRLVPLEPDLIVHAAAWTDVDGCEGDATTAYLHNGLAVRHVRLAAQRAAADLMHISTDYVFDGLGNSPYREWDATGPLSAYGQSKLAGEKEALLYDRAFVVRTSWVVGSGRNFVRAIRQRADSGQPVKVVTDQRGRLTVACDLADALAMLWRSGRYGLWHIANPGECTWHDVAVEALGLAKLDVSVGTMTTAELGRPAPRPAYSVLDDSLWLASGFAPLPSWREAMAANFDVISGVTDG